MKHLNTEVQNIPTQKISTKGIRIKTLTPKQILQIFTIALA